MPTFPEHRIWDYDAIRSLYVYPRTDDVVGLELMLDEGQREATMKLTLRGVRQLRLALQRWEKQQER